MDIIRKISEKYNIVFSDESKESLLSILDRKEFGKDEIILEQGQISRFMYIVESGILRQFYYKDRRDITEHFSSEGNVVTCIESLFLAEPTRLFIEAIEPSVVYMLNYENLKNLTNYHSDINMLLRSILEYKLIISQRKADSWRFESSHERYERFCKDYPSVAQRASLSSIASYLLMAPETLSRVRAGVL